MCRFEVLLQTPMENPAPLDPPSTHAKCLHCNKRFLADSLKNEASRLIAHLKKCIHLRRSNQL
ncbi:hypothetical protein MKX01_039660 [Papaver californicum]|nr:hypothetical protein MKX01_039660 [Papaver californicum]